MEVRSGHGADQAAYRRGIIGSEPELLGEGFSLGDVAITGTDLPERASLTTPGAMFRTKTRVALRPGLDPQDAVETLERQFPDAGFEFRTRDNASPGAERFVSRMGEFLILVGLAALVIAGIGIGGGVASYLEARRTSIATLKVLGASSGDIARELSSVTVSAMARTRGFKRAGMTRSSFAWALATAGAACARPMPRAASKPTDNASASSSVNIIGGNLNPEMSW